MSARPIDHQIAHELATEAGQLLLELRASGSAGDDPAALRAEGDRQANQLLLDRLKVRCPNDDVLSEEAVRSVPAGAPRLWIVDPLDGTREFGELERDDWAVHVALVTDGVLSAGAVALPARGVTYSTAAPPAPPPASDRAPRLAVSRTRPGPDAQRLAQILGGQLVPMGSAGVKAMAVVTGEVDIYAHSGGQYAWDSAAPVAVARAAGLHTSRLDGSPLVYGATSPWLPDLLVCRPELAPDVLSAVAVG